MTARLDIIAPQLRKLYLVDNLSTKQIALILNCHSATVCKKLHAFKIPIKNPAKKVNISDIELKYLYLQKRLSTYKIASILKCNVRTITNKMRKFGIKGRPVKKSNIDKNTFILLYRKKRLSLKNIGKLYNLSPSGVLKKAKKLKISLRTPWEVNTHQKNPFSGSLEEKAYLIGFRLGDLGVRLSSKRTKLLIVGSNTTKKEQVRLIKSLFNKYAKVWIGKPNYKGVMSISTILHSSFSFLLPKADAIENWIKINNKYMIAFMAGYVDAEGSFGVYNNRGKFRLGSYDKHIIKAISSWLNKHGLKTLFHPERKKKPGQNGDFWRLTINDAQSLLNLYTLLYPHLKHKKRKSDLMSVKTNLDLRIKNGTIQI